MSTNLIVFIIAILSASALVYLIYLVSSSDTNARSNKKELQITKKGILEQTEILYNQKKYKLVKKIAKKYLELKPEHTKLRILLAKSLYYDEVIYEAIKECLYILKMDEYNHEIRLLLARCYKKINQNTKAIAELQYIERFEPENIVVIKELSDIYLETNQKVSASKELQKLEKLTDNNLEVVKIKRTLADLYIEFENYPDAFDKLNEILEIYPEDQETNKKLIELYMTVQNYSGAIANCEKMLESNSNNSVSLWLLNNLINLYFIMKDTEKTMYYAQKLLEHPFSDKVKIKTYIAKILINTNKEQEGLDLLNELSKANQNNVEIKRLMIDVFVNKKDFESAIDLYKQIINIIEPDEVPAVHTEISNLYIDWAKYLFEKKDIEDCFKKFSTATTYDNNNPEIFYELGLINIQIKSYNEAIMRLKRALQINSKVSKYYMALSDCYEALGNSVEQKNSLLNAVEVAPEDADAWYKLAVLYENQHDKIGEISSLEKILKIQPNHIDAKHKLALIYESQGNKEDALNLYIEIDNISPNYKNVRENIDMLSSNE